MIGLIRLHTGLVKYIITELKKKKKTPKELVLFGKEIIKVYIKALLQEVNSWFLILDKEYRKKKKEYKKYQQIKVDLQRAIKILQYVDDKMEKSGINRQRRRQFWRDFYSSGQMRKEVFEDLMKETNQIR